MHACYCQRCASIVVMLIFTEVSERIDQEQNYLQKISLCSRAAVGAFPSVIMNRLRNSDVMLVGDFLQSSVALAMQTTQ